MAESGNGSPDDVVFQDEGSFYDPDDRADDQEHGSNESGEPETAVGPTNHDGRANEDRPVGDRKRKRTEQEGDKFKKVTDKLCLEKRKC